MLSVYSTVLIDWATTGGKALVSRFLGRVPSPLGCHYSPFTLTLCLSICHINGPNKSVCYYIYIVSTSILLIRSIYQQKRIVQINGWLGDHYFNLTSPNPHKLTCHMLNSQKLSWWDIQINYLELLGVARMYGITSHKSIARNAFYNIFLLNQLFIYFHLKVDLSKIYIKMKFRLSRDTLPGW